MTTKLRKRKQSIFNSGTSRVTAYYSRRFLGVVFTLFFSVSPIRAADENIVATQYGAVQGYSTAISDVFFGIPYAAPPLRSLRWRAPQPLAAWQHIRQAIMRPNMCMQPNSHGDKDMKGELPVSEDCLYLNVWRPKGVSAGDNLPVMFWMHGGSFIYGASGFPRYDGDHLTRRGVVLVTINYRLGLFGSFTHASIEQEQAGQPRGNYGLMDQIMALEWVRDNIAAFGGDKDNVTIFGNSAGGASVNVLSITPSARGLFHRAIAQSGGIRTDDTIYLKKPGATPFAKPLMDNGQRLAKAFDANSVEQLRALDAQAILDWQTKNNGSFGPAVDGILLTEPFAKPFLTGDIGDVDFMFGVDSWEGSILESIPIPAPVYLRFFDGVDSARAHYGNPTDEVMKTVMFQDKTFFGGARFLTKYAVKHGNTAYLYHFSYRPTAVRGDGLPGAAHSDEVQFIFNHFPGSINSREKLTAEKISDEDRAMADTVADYWTNFAKTGNPNGGELPVWPAYTLENDTWMDLGVKIRPLPEFRAPDMDYWERVYIQSLQ